ncbi:hypothetical protein [Leptolyngbya sp. KIOST-1]|uniref:hypothetical protein n=1 Tax=Leptolyngbya sp. KIOST-1 TaxID=1229172 RepID=UPI00055A8F77|nr:hypothetical protein [Leptolyngbya sp. KIOST-1]
MNRTLNLVGLGVAAAIALLPAQARADVPDVVDNEPALTSGEPLGEGERGAIAPDSSQVPNTSADDTPVSAQADAPWLSSTSSSDLQPIASPLASQDVPQASPAQPLDMAQTPATPAPAERWHFVFTPYVYVPLFVSGSANFKGTEDFRNNFANSSGSGNLTDPSRDFEFVPSDIRAILQSRFNFAFLGALEAWTPNYTFGILGNVDYVSLTNRETLTRDVRRPGLANFIPSELNTALNTQLWNIDLAASYRFYDRARANPEGLHTEHDLGPFVFDVLGGLSIVSLNNQLGLSTNLGGEGQFSSNRTLISPLIGGRFRWNANPKLAVLLSGTVSGFGLSGITQYGFRGGVDWMFSGNTTLGAGYRFGFLNYSSSQLDLDVNQNGPYLNVGLRF